MYKLLFCDDDIALYKDKFIKIIQDVLPDTFAPEFITDEEFTYTNKYDAYFLDIEMPTLSGFDIANSLYQKYPNSLFVFLSNHEEFVAIGYKFHPFDFIFKATMEKDLARVLIEIKSYLDKRYRYTLIPCGDVQSKIFISEILYVKSEGNYKHIHTSNNSYLVNTNKTDVLWFLKDSNILFIRRSIWVNMEHIVRFVDNKILLSSGESFKVSRRLKQECYKKFLKQL